MTQHKSLAEIMAEPIVPPTDAVSLLAEPLTKAGAAFFANGPELVDHTFLPAEIVARLLQAHGIYASIRILTSPLLSIVTVHRLQEEAPEYALWGGAVDERTADALEPIVDAAHVLLAADINVLRTHFLAEEVGGKLVDLGYNAKVELISSQDVVVITYRLLQGTTSLQN